MATGAGNSRSTVMTPGSKQVRHTILAITADTYHQQPITVAVLAASGPGAPVPPGIRALPAPGQVFVSPALAKLLARAPDLVGRYGKVVGQIGPSALPSPDSLLAIRGVTTRKASLFGVPLTGFVAHGDALELTGVARLLLLVGSVAILAPIALLVALATGLSAATRDLRLASLRLAGASQVQVFQLAAIECFITAAVGIALGSLVFVMARPLATHVTYNGDRWFVSDLTPPGAGWAVGTVGVLAVSLLSTQLSLRQVIISPLGVARRFTPRPVRAWRLLPVCISVPLLAYAFSSKSVSAEVGGHSTLLLAAFCLLLLSLIYGGPYFTRLIGLGLTRCGGAASMLAGRRLADNPRAGFKAVSGVILAVLITTMFVAATPAAAESLKTTRITGQKSGSAQIALNSSDSDESRRLLSALRTMDGINDATLVYTGQVASGDTPAEVWIGSCSGVRAATNFLDIPCGRAPILISRGRDSLTHNRTAKLRLENLVPVTLTSLFAAPASNAITALQLPAAGAALMRNHVGIDAPEVLISPAVLGPALAKLRPTLLLIRYGSAAALERAKTRILGIAPNSYVATRATSFEGYGSEAQHLYRVMSIATFGLFGVAGIGLILAVATGLVERRRPFTLLRMTGAPLAVLKRAVLLEASLPLAAMSLLAGLLGALVGHWLVMSGGTTAQPPWLALATPIFAGISLSILVLLACLPLTNRATATEETRFQ